MYVKTHAKITFCVKLSIMPTQMNVKMTAAHMNYSVRTVYSFIKIYQVISDVDIFGIAK